MEKTVARQPLSSLLSNIVLDRLDKELEHCGLDFVRYADEANVFVGSQKAAERVLPSVTRYIENDLKLRVNRSKTQTAPSKGLLWSVGGSLWEFREDC